MFTVLTAGISKIKALVLVFGGPLHQWHLPVVVPSQSRESTEKDFRFCEASLQKPYFHLLGPCLMIDCLLRTKPHHAFVFEM